jgi:hypothetical protein
MLRTMAIDFCDDSELGYRRSRTVFIEGAGLSLDESYRLTHLPLVAPDHVRVIVARDGAAHRMGRHPITFSLTLPVPTDALLRSPAYLSLDAQLRAASFAPKIAWDILERRRDRLHATICNALTIGTAPVIGADVRDALARIGPFTVELRGLFSGNINLGRLYWPVYPQRRDGGNPIHAIQRALGRAATDLYLVGMYNFRDDLDSAEAAALKDIIDAWRTRPILRYRVEQLWILAASDTLVLDGQVAETIPLAS